FVYLNVQIARSSMVLPEASPHFDTLRSQGSTRAARHSTAEQAQQFRQSPSQRERHANKRASIHYFELNCSNGETLQRFSYPKPTEYNKAMRHNIHIASVYTAIANRARIVNPNNR